MGNKGYEWEIRYCGFDINGIYSFDAYYGNKLLYMPINESNKKLKSKIRYLINKKLKGGSG